MIVTIHQLESLVWLGLLDKFSKADVIVLADTFDYKKSYFENRNKIRTSQGEQFITAPVEKTNHKPMREIKIINEENWKSKYLNAIKLNYSKAPYFNKYFPQIEHIIIRAEEYLWEVNYQLILQFLKWFNINKRIILSSSLSLNSNLRATDRLLEICQKVNATTYLSGASGKDYLELEKFKNANIKVEFHEFFHPVYSQVYKPFIPGLSALDLLFNCGSNSGSFINGKGISSMDKTLKTINFNPSWKVLEMFGGKGEGHLNAYANKARNLTIWEFYKENLELLNNRFPSSTIINQDSLVALKKEPLNKFDLIICDPPAIMGYEQILPYLYKFLNPEGFIILRQIIKPYKDNDNIKSDPPKEYFDQELKKYFDIIYSFTEEREYYFLTLWLNNLVYKVRRKI